MADRSITLELGAKVTGFVSGMRTAQMAAGDFVSKGLDKIGRNEQSIRTLSNTAGVMGAALVAGFGAATKAAVDWESNWAGVLKTVEGSPEQLAAVEDGLRELARTMPLTHAEIAATAEAAGQLGVATDDVVDFTETMGMLGVTTNLSAEEAATALARISNIMGTSTKDVGRMGATIVELGNNSATTEAEIVGLATRLAAAGRQAGLTEADIFAIASTLTSVGVEAEAGGTAMSKVFTAIGDAVRDGGDKLETFAEVSGMTAQEFQRAFEEDAAGAIGMFVEGMGRLGAEGESTSQIFKDLGLTDQRLMRAIMSAGTATGLWAEQVDLANEAWESNTALIDEAEKRFATAESQMTVAWNNIRDAAIEFGAVALPYVADLAGAVSDVARSFGELPDWAQTALMAIVGGGGLVLLGVAGLGRLALATNEIVTALRNVGVTADVTKGKVSAIGTALSVAAFTIVADQVMAKMGEMHVAAADVSELTAELERMADGAEMVGSNLAGLFGTGFTWSPLRKEISTTEEAIEAFASSAREALGQDFWDRMDRVGTASADMARLREQTEPLDAAFAQMIESGNIDQAVALFEQFTAAAEEQNVDMEKLVAMFPQYAAALEEAAAESEETADVQTELSREFDATTESVEDQEAALQELMDTQNEHTQMALGERDALRALESAFDTAKEAAKENGDTLDITTEKGRNNQAALDGIAGAALDAASEMRDLGRPTEEVAAMMHRARDQFINAATSMGMAENDARELANELGLLPRNVYLDIQANNWATAQIEAFQRRWHNVNIATAWVTIAARDNLTGGQAAWGARYTAAARAYYGGFTGGPVMDPSHRRTEYRASGGAVFGAGSGTSDSVPAIGPGGIPYRLSNGEHILTAAEVAAVGGHSAVYALRAAMKSGALRSAVSFADGGEVPRFMASMASPGPSVSGSGVVTATLDAESKALLREVASRPVQVQLNRRVLAEATHDARTYGVSRGQGRGF